MKKIMALALTAVMMLGLLGSIFVVSAAEVDSTGQIGPNATWTLYQDGTAVISGTGATYNYDKVDNYYLSGGSPLYQAQYRKDRYDVPFGAEDPSSLRPEGEPIEQKEILPNGEETTVTVTPRTFIKINKVIVEDGITSLGANLFNNITAESIELPKSIESVNDTAFYISNDAGPNFVPYYKGTVYGYESTAAADYANEYGIKFVALEEPVEVPANTAPTAETSNASVSVVVPRSLTPMSTALVNAMNALADMTKVIPEMAPVVGKVNPAIASVIPVIEAAAAEQKKPEAPKPTSDVEEKVVPHVYEAAFMTEVAADIVMDSVDAPAPTPAPEQKIDPEVGAYLEEADAWVNATYELLGE